MSIQSQEIYARIHSSAEQERKPELPSDIWGEIALYLQGKDSLSFLSTQKSFLQHSKKILLNNLKNHKDPYTFTKVQKLIHREPHLKSEVKILAMVGDFFPQMVNFTKSNFPELEELCLVFSKEGEGLEIDIDSNLHPKIKSLILKHWVFISFSCFPPELEKLKINYSIMKCTQLLRRLEVIELGPKKSFINPEPHQLTAKRVVINVNLKNFEDLARELDWPTEGVKGPKHYKIRLKEIVNDIEPFKQKLFEVLSEIPMESVTLIYRRPNEDTDTVEKLELTSQNFKF